MFTSTYNDVSGWMLFGPYFIMAAWLLLSIRDRKRFKALEMELKKYVGLKGQWSREDLTKMMGVLRQERDKAWVEARESSAGHNEAVRQLKAERGNVDRLAESLVQLKEQLRQLTKKPAKKPPVKKVNKPVAKAKRVA